MWLHRCDPDAGVVASTTPSAYHCTSGGWDAAQKWVHLGYLPYPMLQQECIVCPGAGANTVGNG